MGSTEKHNDVMRGAARAALIALVVPVEGPLVEVELDGTLEQLQGLVGGRIEAIQIPEAIDPTGRSTGYLNEEGKNEGLPFNGRGTDFMLPGLFFGDFVAGTLVLCGFNPRRGVHAELPQTVVDRARLIESEAGL
jgi:hypothetical protein